MNEETEKARVESAVNTVWQRIVNDYCRNPGEFERQADICNEFLMQQHLHKAGKVLNVAMAKICLARAEQTMAAEEENQEM
jgi:hypothetical protein